MRNYTITDKQVSALHNGMCSMYRLRNIAQDMFKNDSSINQLINDAFKYIEPVKKELLDKKDAHDNEIRALADRHAKTNGFKYTRWSIYEIDSFLNTSNVPPGATIIAPYESDESVVVEGYQNVVSWLDLWKAVEELAAKTKWDDDSVGFGDHVFIEGFVKVDGKENTYEVWLGS